MRGPPASQSNRRNLSGSLRGRRDSRLPLDAFEGARAMTLLDHRAAETFRESCIPVLETERLGLRAPRPADAKALAQLANDRRIAENTAPIPHPYSLADAEKFIASVNRDDNEIAFLITREKAVLGAVGISTGEREPPDLGYWLGVPFWGHGYATQAGRAGMDHAFADLDFA